MILERSAFITVNLGFTLSFIALLTPGWLTLKMSYQEMFKSGILDQRAFNDVSYGILRSLLNIFCHKSL